MKENSKLSPAFLLRIGLGLTLIYAGLHIFLDPAAWIGFVPAWLANLIDPQTFLSIHAGFELVLGALLIAGIFVPAASLLVFLDFASILVFYGVNDITFRDFGLTLAALALFTISTKRE
jgi:uncharacterized membrane protein YphA (DoxX/SURF4 family)